MKEEEEELGGSGTVINSTNSTEESDEELGRLKNFRISKHTRHLLKGMEAEQTLSLDMSESPFE